MTKLTDRQLVILAAAAQRDDGCILPLPKRLKLDADAIEGVLKDLIKRRLAAEEPAIRGAASWRENTEGQPMALKITAFGIRAIGVQEPEEMEAKNAPRRPTGKPKGRTSSFRSPRALGSKHRSPKAVQTKPGSSGEVRDGSKQAKLIDLLRRPQGASLSEMQKATGWQAHSVRGVMSGALKKKLGLSIASEKSNSGERRYRIAK